MFIKRRDVCKNLRSGSSECGGTITHLEALTGQLDSRLHMIVTSDVAVVYNLARRAKQGDAVQPRRWRGRHYLEPPGQAGDFREGVAQFLEKHALGFTGR